MAANNDGHISFVGQAAAVDAAAAIKEKGVKQEVDSIYDEEETISVKSSDYKHVQV